VQLARSSDTEVETLVSTHQGPVQVLEAAEHLRLLQSVLDRLEPDFRSTLILSDIEGESCASIAASMGVPKGTVYWRLHEARKRFQRALRAERAGVMAHAMPARVEDAGRPREQLSLLALAVTPLWFLSGGRRLLRAGAAQPPVHYDVHVGLERHRELATSAAPPSWAPSSIGASAAGHSGGLAIYGVGGAGIAAAVALAVALLAHPKPPLSEERAAPAVSPAIPVAASPAPSPVPLPPPEPSTRVDLPVPLDALAPAVATRELSRAPSPRSSGATLDPSSSARTNEQAAGKPATSDTSPAAKHAAEKPTAAPVASAAPRTSKETNERAAADEVPENTTPVASDAQVEAKEIARAERMLSSNPAGALAAVQGLRARFNPSFLPEERDYVAVMALRALGRTDEANAAASRFLRAYPGGAFANRVRSAMEK
jgi:predicted DNA-binding protein (UPF0251 family)